MAAYRAVDRNILERIHRQSETLGRDGQQPELCGTKRKRCLFHIQHYDTY